MLLNHCWQRGVALVCCLLISAVELSAGESLARRLPPGALVSVEVNQTAPLLQRVRESETLQTIVDSEPYRKWAASGDGRKVRGGRAILEGQLGLNLWEAAERILGDQMMLALYPPSGRPEPDGVLLIHLADDEISELIRTKLQPWVELAEEKVVATDDNGTWLLQTADQKAFAALRNRWVVLASTIELRAATLALLEAETGESLANGIPWKQTEIESTDAQVSVIADLAGIQTLLQRDRLLPAKTDNPLASLLFGGLMEVGAQSPSVQGSLVVGEQDYSLDVTVPRGRSAVDSAHQTLLSTAVESRALTPEVPRYLGGLTLCRQWAEWYRQRDQLIEEHVLPEYDKFETGLSTFLPGKDFAEDVLALLNSPMSLIAAVQTYPHLDGKPGMQLPAFALVLDLHDPQRGADVFQLFFQTLGTIANIEAGKDGRQPWVMSSEAHEGVQINFARYLDRPRGEELPAVFNYQPAAAVVGRRFIAATSLELCRDLIVTLQQTPELKIDDSAAGRNFELTLEPAVGSQLLELNRALLTAKRVQAGKTLEQATQELDALLQILQSLTPMSLVTDVTPEQTVIRVSGGWK